MPAQACCKKRAGVVFLKHHQKEDHADGTQSSTERPIEEAIARLLAGGIDDGDQLAEVGRLGARLVLPRGVEEEVAVFLARTRCDRTADAQGPRNGVRTKRIQIAEGELEIAFRSCNTAQRFVSQVIRDTRSAIRTRPLEALVIDACVRGLSDRDDRELDR